MLALGLGLDGAMENNGEGGKFEEHLPLKSRLVLLGDGGPCQCEDEVVCVEDEDKGNT